MTEQWRQTQIGGDHYRKHRIQPWDIREEYDLNSWEADVLSYLLRRKSGVPRVEDLRKARHCLDYLIEREEKREESELRVRQGIAAARAAIAGQSTEEPNAELPQRETLRALLAQYSDET